MTRSFLACAAIVVGVMSPLHAEPSAPAPLDLSATLAPILARHKIPGMAALVLRGDKIVAQGVAGVRKAGSPDAITLEDKFHLGSDTKAMTATLIAGLVEEGKLQWTTTLGDLFASTFKDMRPEWKNVTLRQVLAHRAGLPSDLGLLLRAAFAASDTPLPEQRRAAIASVLSDKPNNTPGKEFVYSNVGYILLGVAIEKVTGRAWEEVMQERLFQPLALASAGFGAPSASGRLDQPWGHRANGNPAGADSDNIKLYGPADTVHMKISDWAKFIALHLSGDPANPQAHARLLKPESFAALHTPAPGENYMAGWLVMTYPWAKGPRQDDTGRTFAHSGSNTMWYCTVRVAPEIDFAVLVMCNQGGDAAARACDDAAAVSIKMLPRG
jgi:CubicO group peptidase (beta-lactamase class C family)